MKEKKQFYIQLFYFQLKICRLSFQLEMETIRVRQKRTYVRAKTQKPKAGLYLFLNRMVNS